MSFESKPFTELLSAIVDNRGKTCPVSDEGIPLIATNCVDRSNLYPSYSTTRFVSEDTYKNWFRGHPLPGDILFVCKGSPGRTNLVPDPVDFCIAQDMVAVRADPKKIYPKYLFAALRSSNVQNQIDSLHVGTMIPHFKKGDFDKLNIPMVSDENQKIIGDFYFILSQRITLLREANATLEAVAQGLFKSWFVDFDPVRAKQDGRVPEGMDEATAALFPDSFQESEAGLVPSGWRVGTLANLADLNPETWTSKIRPETIQYVDLANAKNNEIDEVTTFSFDDAPSRARRVLRRGDTVVGTVRPGNRSFAYIYQAASNLTGSTGFAVLRPRDQNNEEFLFIAATRDASIDHLAHVADGGAYPAVRPEVVSSLQTVLPDRDVLDSFHTLAEPIFSLVGANKLQVRTLTAIRDTLLPRLISGQLRLSDAAEMVGQLKTGM